MFVINVHETGKLSISAPAVGLCIVVESADKEVVKVVFSANHLREAIQHFEGVKAEQVSMTLREHASTLVSLAQKEPDFLYVHPDLASHWYEEPA